MTTLSRTMSMVCRREWIAPLVCASIWTLAAGSARAECENCEQAHAAERARQAQQVGFLAWPSNTPRYGGYFVGGGNVVFAGGRTPADGTWGWDYGGAFIRRWVMLGYDHGRHRQGGTGAYKTAGPSVRHSQ